MSTLAQQAMSAATVDVPIELQNALKKFRSAKLSQGSMALVLKVNGAKFTIEEVERFDSISIEDLAEELPEALPRFVVLSHKLEHDDGRVSFPLALINWSPSIAPTQALVHHTTALQHLSAVAGISKIVHITDGPEVLTKEAIDGALLK